MRYFTLRDLLLLAIVVVVSFAIGNRVADGFGRSSMVANGKADNDWLLAIPGETERFRQLQSQMRGFDLTMWETGERFRHMREAVDNHNYELAIYQWNKINTAIRVGLVRRPAKVQNAEALFLDSPFEEVRAGLMAGTEERARQALNRAKGACQACHAAEGVAYMNRQPLFDLETPAAKSETP